jgi:uncharacterized membrane protein YidH (DUF202 family)
MNSVKFDRTEALCGILFVAAGGFFAWQSLNMALGTAFRMGPGYFPFVLAVVLVVLGVVILLRSAKVESEGLGPIAWRGMFFILAAPIFFGFTVRGLGFVPSIFFTALIAAFASQKMSLTMALVLSVLLTIFSVVVFNYGLGLPFQRFGPWLPFLR